MSHSELKHSDTDEGQFLSGISLHPFWSALSQGRRLLWQAALCGAAAAGIIAFLVPNEYRSSARLMPPEQQAISPVSALNPLIGQLPSVASGGLLNQKTPGATSIGILESRTVQDDIINRFDLRRVYHRKLYESTRILLVKNTQIEEDRKNGLIQIAVTDTDRYRAQQMAQAYIEDLNNLLNRLSTSSARREREFLQARLAEVEHSLTVNTEALSRFSSRNATLDYQKQGQATLEIAGKLEAEIISAESDLSALKAVFTDDNVQVRTMSAKIVRLRGQMGEIIGREDVRTGTELKQGEAFPSIRQLPLLGATYADLMRKVSTDEAVYASLQKQYELARVQEAKEIPAVKILDEPDVAEKKVFPPRAGMLLAGALLGLFTGAGLIGYRTLRKQPVRMAFHTDTEPDAVPAIASISAAGKAGNTR